MADRGERPISLYSDTQFWIGAEICSRGRIYNNQLKSQVVSSTTRVFAFCAVFILRIKEVAEGNLRARCKAPQSAQAQLYILCLEVNRKARNFILSLFLKTSLLFSSLPLIFCYSDHLLWLRKLRHSHQPLLLSPQYLYV